MGIIYQTTDLVLEESHILYCNCTRLFKVANIRKCRKRMSNHFKKIVIRKILKCHPFCAFLHMEFTIVSKIFVPIYHIIVLYPINEVGKMKAMLIAAG